MLESAYKWVKAENWGVFNGVRKPQCHDQGMVLKAICKKIRWRVELLEPGTGIEPVASRLQI